MEREVKGMVVWLPRIVYEESMVSHIGGEIGYPSYSCDVTEILGERISAITLTQQRKQWLSVELNRWRSEIIHCYF